MTTSIKTNDFQLGVTLDSGQVFGFEKMADGAYEGSIRGFPVRLRQSDRTQSSGEVLEVSFTSPAPPHGTAFVIADYFDLARDLSGVYKMLEVEPPLLPTLKKLKGLRIIRQDPWEALACFILSSNNNVKRIQGIYKNLVGYFSAGAAPTFPSASQIAKSHERILRQLGLGYRAPFLMNTARFVSANPVCLEVIRNASYEEAVRRVLLFPGIGPKVADCVLLYGFHKTEAFPVDVWILRAVRKLYFRNRSVSEKKVQVFGQKRWGADAGYVQQYLFHAARTGLLV